MRGEVDLDGVAEVRRRVAVARDGHVQPRAVEVDRAPHVLMGRSEDAPDGPARPLRAPGEVHRVNRAITPGDIDHARPGSGERDRRRAPDPVDPVGQVEAIRLDGAEVPVPDHMSIARSQGIEVAVLGSLIDHVRRDPVDVDRRGLDGLGDHDVPEIDAPQRVKLRGIAGPDRRLAWVVAGALLVKAVREPAHASRRSDRRRPSQPRAYQQRQHGKTTHVM